MANHRTKSENMMRSFFLCSICLLILHFDGTSGQSGGDEDITESALKTVSTPKEPCECVAYYLCVDGYIVTDGIGMLDIRSGLPRDKEEPPAVNVEVCPDLFDVCCKLRPVDTTPAPVTTTQEPTLPPSTPCTCMNFLSCPLELHVSDGKGNTSLVVDGVSWSHSKCKHALDFCCADQVTSPGTTPGSRPTPLVVSPGSPHCQCVEYYQCDDNGFIITDGSGLLSPRFANVLPVNGKCLDPDYVCCLPISTTPEYTTTSTTTTPTTTTSTTTPPPVKQPCGTRNTEGVNIRVVGFKDGQSQFGEFPWVAAILRQESILGQVHNLFVGGGTLITKQIVLTAAHKVSGLLSSTMIVRLGEWDTQTESEPMPYQDLRVKEIVIHPLFHPRTLFHDIALLILEESVKRDRHIGDICPAEILSKVNHNKCVINGWGKNGFDKTNAYQHILKSVSVPLVSHEQCQNALRTTRLGRHFILDESFICAGGEENVDSCKGDGGGPLACERVDAPGRYLLVGVVAWGIGCGVKDLPGVYGNVVKDYYWITDEIQFRFPSPKPTSSTALPYIAPVTETGSNGVDEGLKDHADYKKSSTNTTSTTFEVTSTTDFITSELTRNTTTAPTTTALEVTTEEHHGHRGGKKKNKKKRKEKRKRDKKNKKKNRRNRNSKIDGDN